MPTDISETGLEAIIERALLNSGYEKRTSQQWNRDFCLDEEQLRSFLMATQADRVARSRIFDTPQATRKFLERVKNDVTKRGIVDVLRHGVSHNAYDFVFYYPTPDQRNPEAVRQYGANKWGVIRQLHFSNERPIDSIDMVITLNGLPVLTMELKNDLTRQNAQAAIRQYRRYRDPKELLFKPKRCAVHLAVDDNEAWMCTKLDKAKSWFLPFNKGYNDGAGNPPNPNGLKSAYIWEEILQKPTLSLILENYAQVISERDEETRQPKEKVIWPRYHQLEAVRRLLADTEERAIGRRYLIQHSAGSGKSNTITWLAYQLVNMKDGESGNPLFESIVVVTDRVNLDKQIRDNIHAFCNNRGIVAWADNSEALRSALNAGKKIIVSTVCKFPFILQSIGEEMRAKKFAVIIDEAHSSQSGSMATALNRVLAGFGLRGVEITDNEDGLNLLLEKVVKGRRLAGNVNFYAFTATPKNKTLEMFGTPTTTSDGETSYQPFHLYSMRQAIEEGFIMDVLDHYTTYDSFYKIIKATEANPEFDKDQASRKLRLWVESRPETIEKKARIIVEHFHESVAHKIGGEARAMVVCAGIERAIAYYFKIKELLRLRNSPYKPMIAFSGTKEWEGTSLDESAINGFPSSRIEKEFAHGAYRFLIVADKFQTGYDQPLLHTMYVDKQLSDIKAVQTLSRLNRCHPLKSDTYVLDFMNDADTIQAAFQRYYKKTILSHETDVNRLADKLAICDQSLVYQPEEVEGFNRLYWGGAERETLDPLLDVCVERFNALELEDKIQVKAAMKQFVRLYEFLSAIRDIQRTDWEQRSCFLLFLLRKLPPLPREDWAEGLIELVDFERYRVVKGVEQRIRLENENSEIEPVPTGNPASGPESPELETLERIVDDFNLVFGDIEWGDADMVRYQVRQVVNRLQQDDDVRDSILNNDEDVQMQNVHQGIENALGIVTANSNEMFRRYVTEPGIQERLDAIVLSRLQEYINPEINEEILSEKLLDEFTPDFRPLTNLRPVAEAIEWLFKVLDTPTTPMLDGVKKLKRTLNLVYRTEGRQEDRHDWLKLLIAGFEAYLKKVYYMAYNRELSFPDGRRVQFLEAANATNVGRLHFTTDPRLANFKSFYEFLHQQRNTELHQAPVISDAEVGPGIHMTTAMYLYATLINITDMESGERRWVASYQGRNAAED